MTLHWAHLRIRQARQSLTLPLQKAHLRVEEGLMHVHQARQSLPLPLQKAHLQCKCLPKLELRGLLGVRHPTLIGLRCLSLGFQTRCFLLCTRLCLLRLLLSLLLSRRILRFLFSACSRCLASCSTLSSVARVREVGA